MSTRVGERNQEKLSANFAHDKRHLEQTGRKLAGQNFHLIMQMKSISRFSVSRSPEKKATMKSSIDPSSPDHSKFLRNDGTDCPAFFPREADYSNAIFLHQWQDKAYEKDPNIIAHSAIASGRTDDISLLLKKLTLNFSAKHQDARFSISTGVFAGTQFALVTNDKNLQITVNNASSEARHIIKTHHMRLKNSLALREINLHEIMFI